MSDTKQPDSRKPYGYNPEDPIDPKLMPLVNFVSANRENIGQIYDMEHSERGTPDPNNQGNPGCLVITRTPDDKVEIYYFPWMAMEPKLQESVAVEKENDKIVLLVLIDKITVKSVMISMDRIEYVNPPPATGSEVDGPSTEDPSNSQSE